MWKSTTEFSSHPERNILPGPEAASSMSPIVYGWTLLAPVFGHVHRSRKPKRAVV